jgi:hypothetical protein
MSSYCLAADGLKLDFWRLFHLLAGIRTEVKHDLFGKSEITGDQVAGK